MIDVCVIGGGAAGMIAALFAAREGADVILLEKNEKLGKKVYITGKGRCNVTNDCPDLDTFLHEVPRNPRFLYSSLRNFMPRDMMALLEELNCPLKVERGRRVFPQSDKASDITRALEKGILKAGGKIRLHTSVQGIFADGSGMFKVITDKVTLLCKAVIIATGGLSYPSTGSTGDGYRFAKEAGLEVTQCFPSLTGIETEETWPAILTGLSLKNVSLSALRGNKLLFDEQGEMLFTHYGISGPLVLNLSSVLAGTDLNDTQIFIDLKPALSEQQLDERLKRELIQNGSGELNRIYRGMLPGSLSELFAKLTGIDGRMRCAQVSAQNRQHIVKMLKEIPLKPASLRSYSEAIITRGGVSVKEISPSTMMSKKLPGLFFAGEVLDVDARTGGYNLQIAFSTGVLAGKCAAEFAG
ncbi:MAG: aminoacetone oxidase family FAD-binding enzyme [Clostridiales bacterium]|nr:aminoacetone oxidase family FAD-binding enzyme [Clostridiales bacterium]